MTAVRGGRSAAGLLALVLACGVAAGGPSGARAAGGAADGFLVPPQAIRFDVGGPVDIDGVPTDTLGFVSRHPPAVVAAWVRDRWPAAHTDDRLGARRILGRVDGARHLTLVLEPTADGGSRGIWAAADLRAAVRGATSPRRPPSWAPAGSEPLQRLVGRDATGTATTWLLRHGQAPQVVSDHLTRQLAGDRMVLQQRLRPGVGPAGSPGRSGTDLLVFAGPGGRAVAAIVPLGGGGSASALVVTAAETPR